MKLYAEVKLRIVEKNNFSDAEGKTVEYCTNYLQDAAGQLIQLNSKEDFSKYEGKSGMATIEAREDAEKHNRFKLSLKAFVEGEAIETPPDIM